MSRIRLLVYAALLAAAGGAYLLTHTERAAIRRTFGEVARIAAKEPGEPVMQGMAKANALKDYLAEDGCRFTATEAGLRGMRLSRSDFAGGVLAFRSGAGVLKVAFRDLEIAVADGQAQVRGVADFDGSDATPRLDGALLRTFDATLRKSDDKRWRFTAVALAPSEVE